MIGDRPRRPRNKKPLSRRERLRRVGRELIAGWWFWLGLAGYCVFAFTVALDPLVEPLMPSTGKYKILGVYPASRGLLDGGAIDGIRFAVLWLPIAYSVIRFPFWLKGQREWERQAAIRRVRDRERRARRRAEREAERAAAAAPVTESPPPL